MKSEFNINEIVDEAESIHFLEKFDDALFSVLNNPTASLIKSINEEMGGKRVSDKIDSKYLFTLLNRESIRKDAQKKMTGSSGHKRVPIKFYEELEIPLLNIAEQKSFVTKIEKLEKVISNANSIIDSSNEKKQIILDKYLK